MDKNIKSTLLWVSLIAILSIIPFLGLQEYNTKGEPREAIVAYSMLQNGNWILPTNNGGDIAYKPPFFHWCIAVCSLLPGQVSEFTSRLPSALGLIGMVIGGFLFYARRKNTQVAFLAALLTLTSFEVHRAGYACRVDMLLTAFIVGALYMLYRWTEKKERGIPWLAILFMSLATLTKGPVGIILPCFVIGVFLLLRDCRIKPILMLAFSALLACVIPACWYLAAYNEGGQTFVNLIMDENFRRFTGHMSYDSHVNPFYYNFITIIAGWAPWTLLGVVSLFFLNWKLKFAQRCNISNLGQSLMQRIRNVDALQLFTWLAFLLILFFYCIPKSKRSVYLLPLYPFMAVLIAEYLIWLLKHKITAVRIVTIFFAICSIILPIVFIAVKCGMVPDTIFHGRHAYENILMLKALEGVSFFPIVWLFVFLPLAFGVYTLLRQHSSKQTLCIGLFGCIFSLYLSLDAVYQPTVINVKSDKPLAVYIDRHITKGKIYSYVAEEMLRFYMTDFYLGDKVAQFERDMPQNGYLMIGENDSKVFLDKHNKDYRFIPISKTMHKRRDIEQVVCFYKFTRSSMK